MSRWFRLYDDLVDDPKVQRLSGDMVKALINLWCLASKNGGYLPPIDEVAFKLRTTEKSVAGIVAALISSGLLDEDENGLTPHNWKARQFKSDVSNERVKRHRERKCNVTTALHVTPPETEQSTENRKIGSDEPIVRLAVSNEKPKKAFEYPVAFLLLWDTFPRHPNASKSEAFKSWRRLSPPEQEACLDGAMEYERFLAAERQKRPDYPALHLATFINQRRWEGLLEAAQ